MSMNSMLVGIDKIYRYLREQRYFTLLLKKLLKQINAYKILHQVCVCVICIVLNQAVQNMSVYFF